MDILTHGLLGASLAQSLTRNNRLALASLSGFVGGILADVDILVRSSDDPLLNLEVHRALTHWLLFIPIGGCMAAALLWPWLRNNARFRDIFLFTTAGYATHALLDACTSYGTHLFGPFTDNTVAWNLISVVDPIATLILLLGFGVALTRKHPRPAQLGLLIFVGYLAIGAFQHERARSEALTLAFDQGHQPQRLVVKPTLGNLVLWRTLYEHDGHYYINAVRVGLSTDIVPGDRIATLNPDSTFSALDTNRRLYQDIQRFHRFADGYLVWHPQESNVIGDIRYAMLPQETAPLWGIRLPENWREGGDRITFEHFRRTDADTRQGFIDMVFGHFP
ncbi:MAG: metal-dependent hydrolase [Saccharospirillum sp.]